MFNKKFIFVLVGIAVLLIGGVIIYAAVDKTTDWHSASDIKIKIDGTDRTLQYAIDNNLLLGSNTYASSSTPNPGHDASEIWVSTTSGEKTLLSALSTVYGLSKDSATFSYSSNPSTSVYHFANEIEITGGDSFQDAIDSIAFGCTPKTCADFVCGTNLDDGCGGTLNCPCSGTLDTCFDGPICCVSNYGGQCREGVCATWGAIDCAGSCAGSVVKDYGIVCGNIFEDPSHFWYEVCDGESGADSSCNRIIDWYAGDWGACDYSTATQTRNVGCYIYDSLDTTTGNPETEVDAFGYCSSTPTEEPATSQTCELLHSGTGCTDCPLGEAAYPWEHHCTITDGVHEGRYSPYTGGGWTVWKENPTICEQYGCFCATIPGVCIWDGWCWKDVKWEIRDI